MDEQDMRGLIEKYIHAYNTFDIDGMLALMHPAIVFKNVVQGEVTLTTEGIEALRQVAEQSKSLFASRCQTVQCYRFGNECAEVEIAYEGVFAVDIPNGPKAGETVKLKGKSLFQFRDGRIVSLEDQS